MARVLVVDDNPDERVIYSAVLRHHGYDVEEAGEAITAIESARATLPDLILMDIQLPVVDGLLATEILRSTPATADIPIVCVSGYDISPKRALDCGCVRFLRKPVDPSVLAATIASTLSEYHRAQTPPTN